MTKREEVGLAAAAHMLSVGYWTCRTMLLRHELDGRQDPLNGRWYVTRESVERALRSRKPRAA